MVEIAKRSVLICFENGPSKNGVQERKVFTRVKKNIFSASKVGRNAAFSRLLIDSFVTPFRILIKFIGTIFFILEIFNPI